MHDRKLLPIGSKAPSFAASANDGTVVDIDKLRQGGRVILIFYPADDTAMCTAQLCELRDDWNAIKTAGIQVLGINPASVDRHASFAAKHSLPFPLISDTQGLIARQYGCRMVLGLIRRTVYVIDSSGLILYSRRGKPSVSDIMAVITTK